MHKTSKIAVVTFLVLILLVFLPAPSFVFGQELRDESVKSLSVWIKEISGCKPGPGRDSISSRPSPTTVEPSLILTGKTVEIQAESIPESIMLPTYFSIKAGNVTLYPCDLKQGDFITITYKNRSIQSVSLDKVNRPWSVKIWAIVTGIVVVAIFFLMLGKGWKAIKGVLLETNERKGKKEIGALRALIVGYDNRYSNSKFQMALWTFLVIFTYVMFYSERLYASTRGLSFLCAINIPDNLLILMGITSTSFVGAKLVTSSKVESGTVSKERADKPGFSDLISNDAMNIDLGDVQMLAWTVVAALIYFAGCVRILLQPVDFVPSMSLPDIDTTLLALTGISQAAYLTKKMATSDVLKIDDIDPSGKGATDANIVIKGAGFGTEIGEVTIGKEKGKEISLEIVAWYDANIKVKIGPADKKTKIDPGKTTLTVKTPKGLTAACQYEILP